MVLDDFADTRPFVRPCVNLEPTVFQPAEAPGGANPEHTLMVFKKAPDTDAGEAIFNGVGLETDTVESGKAILCAQP